MKVLTIEESKLHDDFDTYVIAYDDTFNKKYVIRHGKLSDFKELERIATEYESNKHYIELGKAVEKAFNKNCDIYLYEENESVNGYLLGYGVEVAERITKPEQLLEWAEGRE